MADEVVVGATRKDLLVVLIDANSGLPIDLTGPNAAARLQGRSPDLPAVNIDGLMTIVAPAAGQVKFSGLGTLVTHANLAGASITSAVYRLRVKYTDNALKVDWGPEFELVFKDTPLGT